MYQPLLAQEKLQDDFKLKTLGKDLFKEITYYDNSLFKINSYIYADNAGFNILIKMYYYDKKMEKRKMVLGAFSRNLLNIGIFRDNLIANLLNIINKGGKPDIKYHKYAWFVYRKRTGLLSVVDKWKKIYNVKYDDIMKEIDL